MLYVPTIRLALSRHGGELILTSFYPAIFLRSCSPLASIPSLGYIHNMHTPECPDHMLSAGRSSLCESADVPSMQWTIFRRAIILSSTMVTVKRSCDRNRDFTARDSTLFIEQTTPLARSICPLSQCHNASRYGLNT